MDSASPFHSLRGISVIVVEDDEINAFTLQELLRSAGVTVIGPFTTIASAMAGLEQQPDLAVIDYRLHFETTDLVVAACQQRSIPIVLVTAWPPKSWPEYLASVPILMKPYDFNRLLSELRLALAQTPERNPVADSSWRCRIDNGGA